MNSKSSDGNGAKQSPPDVELLTPKEAAQVLKLSESFLAKARMRGDGPRYRKLSKSVRYLKADLLAWLKACAKTSTAERLQDDRRPAVALLRHSLSRRRQSCLGLTHAKMVTAYAQRSWVS
jgi:predicted DNA-binding transcriptional regulator AlpA